MRGRVTNLAMFACLFDETFPERSASRVICGGCALHFSSPLLLFSCASTSLPGFHTKIGFAVSPQLLSIATDDFSR